MEIIKMDKQAQVDVKNQSSKIKGRYIAIQLKMKNIDNEMNDKYYMFDFLQETNKNNTTKFSDNLYVTLGMMAYIYQNNIIKVKNNVLNNSFLDDFRI